MPPAVGMAIGGLASGAGAATGGKKGGGAAKKAAEQQFQMQQQLFNTALGAWNPAANYWKALLSGDPNAVSQAVGPYADIIRGQGQASAQQLAATSPAGGQTNLAQAQNQMGQYSQIARLSAGMQPAAASALGQLAGMPMSISAPNVSSGLKYDTHAQEQASAAKGGLGQGLGQLYATGKQGKRGGGGASGGGSTSGAGLAGSSVGSALGGLG